MKNCTHKYAYALGDAAYNGDWKRYDELHTKMRKECWPAYARVMFRIGRVVRWLKKNTTRVRRGIMK